MRRSIINSTDKRVYVEKRSIEERAIELAHYIIDSKDTVRGAAAKFGISKSTVHTERSALQKK